MSDGPPPSAALGFFGAMFVVVGALIVILCGLCTGCGVIISLGGDSEFGGPGTLLPYLTMGGVPTLIGIGLIVIGWKMQQANLKRSKARAKAPGDAP